MDGLLNGHLPLQSSIVLQPIQQDRRIESVERRCQVPKVTEVRERVRSLDTDSQGIVNNTKYFELFQDARLDHLMAIRNPDDPWTLGPDSSFVLASTTCNYKNSLRHRDEIVTRAWTAEVRTRSFVLGYDVRLIDGTVVADGSSVQVWINSRGEAIPLPDPVRRSLEASLTDS